MRRIYWYLMTEVYPVIHRKLFGFHGLLSYTLRPKVIARRIKWRHQRASRGWADNDCWNTDGYVTNILSGMLLHLADNNHAYPGMPPWETPEKWDAHLRDLAARLRAWNNDTFCSEEAYTTTRDAMEEFGRNLGHYWD